MTEERWVEVAAPGCHWQSSDAAACKAAGRRISQHQQHPGTRTAMWAQICGPTWTGPLHLSTGYVPRSAGAAAACTRRSSQPILSAQQDGTASFVCELRHCAHDAPAIRKYLGC
jgi:hypothetical protein